jgi:hypothetical protein
MLLSMSFEELFKSPISFDGSTPIHAVWRRKEPKSHYLQPTSGLPRTYVLHPGILNWMESHLKRWREDW